VFMAMHKKMIVLRDVTVRTSVADWTLMHWVPPERLNQSARLHGVTYQKTLMFLVYFIKYWLCHEMYKINYLGLKTTFFITRVNF
jgi:hypothetical protein